MRGSSQWRWRAMAAACLGVLCVFVVPTACGIQRPSSFATGSAVPFAPRLPDGVAVDLRGALPPVASRATTTSGLLPLREPPDTSGALSVVRAFFVAVFHEDMPALRSALSSDASQGPLAGPANGPADRQWEQRINKLDYKVAGPEPVYRESSIEVYVFPDLESPEGDRPSRPAAMTPDDILVRVPIEIRRVGTDRLFGDEILFLVRRTDGVFKIRTMLEDFQPP